MKEALEILRILLEKGEINDTENPDQFANFRSAETRENLDEMKEALEFDLVEAPHSVYLVPKMDNPFLSVSLGDLRKEVGMRRNADAFLRCYIIMVILYLFYGSKNADPCQRTFLQISDIAKELDHRFSTESENKVNEWQDEMEINFTQTAQMWSSMSLREEGKSASREQTVLKVCHMMESQKLVQLYNEKKEIRPTNRLKDLMLNYYLHEERVSAIQELFRKGE